jgi:hypothetical protein
LLYDVRIIRRKREKEGKRKKNSECDFFVSLEKLIILKKNK